LRISTGELTALDCPLTQIGAAHLREDGLLLLSGASPTQLAAIHVARLDRAADPSADERAAAPAAPSRPPPTVLRSSRSDARDPGLLPEGESIEVPLPDGGVVHAIVHRPRQEGLAGREHELPPFLAQVHGGPTAHVSPVRSLPVAYYPS